MAITTDTLINPAVLPRLLQLCSPTLPVGAYAYSQGLESAVEQGWVQDEASAGAWILGLLDHTVRRLDLPVFARLYGAWQGGEADAVRRWNARLYASREAAELQREDQQLGAALARLLSDLGLDEAAPWLNAIDMTCPGFSVRTSLPSEALQMRHVPSGPPEATSFPSRLIATA